MPISKHYGGHGEEVMRAMKKEYDPETAKRVFYARENKLKSLSDHIKTIKKKRKKY